MKGLPLLICLCACLIIFLIPGADAACNRSVSPVVIMTTFYPPGPYGTIYVETSPPGAMVSLNGQNKGRSPLTVPDLWPGSYTVSADLAGYQKYTATTTISGPTRSSVYCRLIPDSTGNGLYIMSDPDTANVYLDGALRGTTPLMLSNTATGSHTLQVRHSGYAEWKATVEASLGGTKTISAILTQADTDTTRGLNVSSNPENASVFLDGVEKGVTPLSLNTMAAGIHVLEIGYPGYNSWKSAVDVPETQIKEISINLTPKAGSSPGWITVSSHPENASVTLDGDYVGRTPRESALTMDTVMPGEHTVVLALPGFKSYSTTVTVSPNLVTQVNTTLVPVSGIVAKGSLSVTSEPAGAAIFVDNRSVGTSPLDMDDIAAGDHVITLRMKGYKDYTTGFLVNAGTSGILSATLSPATSTLYSPVNPLTVLAALGIIVLSVFWKRS